MKLKQEDGEQTYHPSVSAYDQGKPFSRNLTRSKKQCPSKYLDEFKKKEVKIEECKDSIPFKFTCAICNNGFQDKSKFQSHIKIHLTDRYFQCQTCGRTYKNQVILRQHMKKKGHS